MLLRGSIPTEIGNLEMLSKLSVLHLLKLTHDITKHPLTDCMFLLNFSSADLNLKSNNLDRSLPDEIKDLVNLESLYLTSNSFTEMIPQSWSSLVNLSKFPMNFTDFYRFDSCITLMFSKHVQN